MESEDKIILEPKDYEDLHRLAAKIYGRDPSQPGRPTKEETEFREFLRDFQHYRMLKSTGVFDQFLGNLRGSRGVETTEGVHNQRKRRDSSRRKQSLFGGLLSGDSQFLRLFTEETLQETIQQAVVTYGPIVGLIAALWIAETHLKLPTGRDPKSGEVTYTPIPPVLHTSYMLLTTFLSLLTTIIRFLNEVAPAFGAVGKVLKDPGQIIKETTEQLQERLQETVADPAGIGKDFIAYEVKKHQKQIEKAMKGDIFALAYLASIFNPVTLAAILAGDYTKGSW